MTRDLATAAESIHRDDDPDVQLMLQVQQDVPGAFERLVERHQGRIVRLLSHVVGNSHDAEDLAQEVFLRVYRNRRNYAPTARFTTWLFTIAHHLSLNSVRNRKRRPRHADFADVRGDKGGRPLEDLLAASSTSMPSRIFAKAETAEIVRAAVQQLSEEQRMALLLNKFENLNLRQIAAVMNRSEMAVKSLLSRARCSLRDLLEPHLQPKG